MMDDAIFTLNGTSDPDGCYNATKRLFDFGAPCAEPPCSIDGVHSPLPFGSFKVCLLVLISFVSEEHELIHEPRPNCMALLTVSKESALTESGDT